MKLILTKKGEMNALAKMFGVSRIAVHNALHFRYNSELCERFRKAAIERGGKEAEYNS